MIGEVLVIGLITTIVAILGSILFKVKSLDRKMTNIKGPPRLPVLGNGLLFAGKTPQQILKTLEDSFKTHGKIVKFWILDDPILFVCDPKICEVILTSQKLITKSVEYDFLRNWLGDGLLLSTGKKWFGRRKAITPTFHFKILEQFVDVFDKQSNTFVDVLRKYKPNESVDIYPLVTLAALDVICESAMGTTANAQINTTSKYVNAVKDIVYVLHLRMFDFLLRSKWFFPLTPSAQMERKAVKIMHDFTDNVIVSRRNELLENQKNNNNNNNDDKQNEGLGIKKKMAFLDVLLQTTIEGKPLTNYDIREEVDTFMFEGHDTTTSGISFTLYLIAQHPKVQEKLVKEIIDVIGDDVKKPVTLQMLNELHYLDVVIKESMRLFPPVPIVGRKITEDTRIDNITLPKGVSVTLGVLFMNRDPENFPEPNKFLPERWEEERSAEKLNPYAYVPFSAGPRNCIGQKFAVLEMKSLVSKVLRNFEISVDPGYKEPLLVAELILRPQNGLNLNFKPRTL